MNVLVERALALVFAFSAGAACSITREVFLLQMPHRIKFLLSIILNSESEYHSNVKLRLVRESST